jgi:hypothetical protein
MISGESFTQLLQSPVRAGVIGHIEVQDSTPAQFHENEHIQDTESGCDHDEEVTGHHRLGVITNEGQPALAQIGLPAGVLAQILADRARRNSDARSTDAIALEPNRGSSFLSSGKNQR